MTLYNMISATRTALPRLTDESDLRILRRPLNDFRADCTYFEFIEDKCKTPHFRADTVHVVGNNSSRNTHSVRRKERTPGREIFSVPSLKLTSPGTICLLDPKDRCEKVSGFCENLLENVGLGLSSLGLGQCAAVPSLAAA